MSSFLTPAERAVTAAAMMSEMSGSAETTPLGEFAVDVRIGEGVARSLAGSHSRTTSPELRTFPTAEVTEHVGYDRYDPAVRERGSNSRNGTRAEMRRATRACGHLPPSTPH